MMTEDPVGDEGEVVVVVPERAVHVDDLYPGANKHMRGTRDFVHRFEIIAACVMGLSTLSGGILEGYTSTSLPIMLPEDNFTTKIPDILTTKIPDTVTTIFPDIVTTSFPDIVTTKIPDIATTKIPDIVTTSFPDIATTNFPDIFTTQLPDLSTTDTPDVNTTLIPSITNTSLFVNDSVPESSSDDILAGNFSGVLSRDSRDIEGSDFYLTEDQASWVGSLLLLGACVGASVSSWVISLGRRRAVMASALPRLAGWIMIAASSDIYMMYGGRFLTGVSLGVVTSAAPVYISEVAHSSVRGALSCVVQLGVNLGIFIAALLGTFLEWRGLAVFGAVTVVCYFCAAMCIPDSPVWLVGCGREDDAREALRRLRGNNYSVEYDLQQIISAKASQYNAYSWRDVLRLRVCVVPLGVVALVTVVNRCSGYNAIITFCSTFLHQAVPAVSHRWAAAGVTLMQVVSTGGAAVLVDGLGRRKLLITSIAAMAAALATIAICDLANSHGAGGSWVAIVAAIVYVSAYSLGVGPITWVLVGEMFPQAARDKAAAIISVLNWFLAFVITKTYFRLESVAGLWGTCSVYSGVCVAGLVMVYLVVPETKGRSLGEIEAHFTYARHPWGRSTTKRRDVALSSILGDHDTLGGGPTDSYSTFHSH